VGYRRQQPARAERIANVRNVLSSMRLIDREVLSSSPAIDIEHRRLMGSPIRWK
jgi:hypothetical protein